jgi:ATP adenylyltransferase
MPDRDHHPPASEVPEYQPSQRFWTPWRMQYVGGEERGSGCVFCDRLAEEDDVASLILHRGERSFAIMNLFPYNTGHAMILPNDHVATPEALDDATAIEMTRFLPRLLAAVRSALGPGGFNVGMNLGSTAGAGIADHLHQHIVPRWPGDANFMPIIANTKALPELIPVTYAKIRAELERGPGALPIVALTPDGQNVLLELDSGSPRLPHSTPVEGTPLWRTGANRLRELGAPAFLLGWAGESLTGGVPQPALAYLATPATGSALTPHSVTDALNSLPGAEAAFVSRAIDFARDGNP